MQEFLTRLVVVPVESVIWYVVFFPLSIPGVLALIGGLWLTRQERLLPKLWYLIPIGISELAAVIFPMLVAAVYPLVGWIPDSWAVIFALLQVATITLAVRLNRVRIWPAVLLAVFPATFAITTFVMASLNIACRNGC